MVLPRLVPQDEDEKKIYHIASIQNSLKAEYFMEHSQLNLPKTNDNLISQSLTSSSVKKIGLFINKIKIT